MALEDKESSCPETIDGGYLDARCKSCHGILKRITVLGDTALGLMEGGVTSNPGI